MTNLTHEQYHAIYGVDAPDADSIRAESTLSDLTAAIVSDLTANADTFAYALSSNMRSIERNRSVIRDYLEATGQITRIPTLTHRDYSIAAIDGGVAVEPLYAVDLIATVAVAVEGTIGQRSADVGCLTWAAVPARHVENGRIARLHMLVDELRLLTQINHDVRLIDGSHMNPLVELAKGLFTGGELAREAIRLLDAIDFDASIAALTAPRTGVASLAKGDTGTVFGEEIKHAIKGLDRMPALTDKALAALVLEEGEMLVPHRLAPLAERPLNVGDITKLPTDLRPAAQHFNKSVEPLRDAVRDGLMRVTFMRPERSVTAIRVQFVASDSTPETALSESRDLLARIAAEVFGPDMQEPFPQYAADLAAKSVSSGIASLKYAIISSLSPEDSDFAALLARNYRT